MTVFHAPAFPRPLGHRNGQNELHTARTAPYLRVPERLLREYAHDPLAVGVYLAVARCALAQKGPVPLSSADLAAWGGAPHERDITIARRLRRLSDDGWLVAEAGRSVKAYLRPAWALGASWRFDNPHQGKPSSVRTVRVPLELFDNYLGRLEPRPGRTPALITRYFDRPLLDLVELGSYALACAGYITSSLRLRQLGLADSRGPLALQPLGVLLSAARASTLQLVVGDEQSTVSLSVAGWRRLGYDLVPPQLHNGSSNGSSSGSNPTAERITQTSQQELPFIALECDSEPVEARASANAWDSRSQWIESTNLPPLDSPMCGGGGEARSASLSSEGRAATAAELDAAVQRGHEQLNPARPVPPGEWLELLRLQREHGAERLLVWQARATRAPRDVQRGIVPGYYVACAADEACASVRPEVQTLEQPVRAPTEPAASSLSLDPACDALLQAMGVRQRAKLAGVPLALLAAWHAVLEHPGLATRFADPVAFAVSQLAAHTPPPSLAELERWAAWQPRHGGNTPLPLIAPSDPTSSGEHSAWENHARRLLPGASSDAIRHLASFLAQGASDDEALALLADQQAYEAQLARGEVLV